MKDIKVAILGATGAVGQKALALLGANAFEVAASEEKCGQRYSDAVNWQEELPFPETSRNLILKNIDEITAPYVISALPADVASHWEKKLAQRGHHIFSNASTHRMDPDVPLLIPEINLNHLHLLDKQTSIGKIISNPNCTTAFIAMALAPLQKLGNITHVSIVTMQAISGAGNGKLPPELIMGNTLPHIDEEGEKIIRETKKILDHPPFSMTVHTHRVPVAHGHTATIHIHFEEKISSDRVMNHLEEMAPPYKIYREGLAPQPRYLTPIDNSVHIGQIKQGGADNIVGLVVMGHNLVRGAAGGALMNLHAFLKYSNARSFDKVLVDRR